MDINDINMDEWQAYSHIRTGSLWVINRRDNTGAHNPTYPGNFIPEIPRQAMLRYTRLEDWVLDPFVGGGTSAIEARRYGRNFIGIDLQPAACKLTKTALDLTPNPFAVDSSIVCADSTQADYAEVLADSGVDAVDLILTHPPYWNIIPYSDHRRDLSAVSTVEEFFFRMEEFAGKVTPCLREDHFLVLVMGDVYHNSEWIPMGFETMRIFQLEGLTLKSVVVKNFGHTREKSGMEPLWRWRALKNGFYTFEHEYIFFFEK